MSWIRRVGLADWLRAARRALQATFPNASRVALLIDADNIAAKLAAPMLHDVSTLGRVSTGRVYANFAGPKMDTWASLVRDWNLRPVHGYRVTPGKNAADIALVVDAVDLLRDGAIDVFALGMIAFNIRRLWNTSWRWRYVALSAIMVSIIAPRAKSRALRALRRCTPAIACAWASSRACCAAACRAAASRAARLARTSACRSSL